MSAYLPPTQFLPIYNEAEYLSMSNPLTITSADSRYLKLTGGTETGLVSFNSGLNTTIILGSNGSAAIPAYSFTNDSTTGMYLTAPGFLNFSCSGVSYASLSSSQFYPAVPISIIDGTVGVPSIRFGNDTNTGIYLLATDNPAISAGGVNIMNWTSTRASIPINGSAAAPCLVLSDSTTGFYRSATNEISISTQGQQTVKFTTQDQRFIDKVSGIQRCIFRSSETSGDLVNFFQTAGSTSTYWYYNMSNAYGTICDEKTKKNIRDIDTNKACEFIEKITAKRYELKTNDATNNGFIAQDLKAVSDEVGEFSEIITDHDNGMLGIAHNEMLTVITAAVQNLISRVKLLEKK